MHLFLPETKVISTCAENGAKLGVVLQNRFNPPMADVKNLLQEDGLGELLLGNATVRWYRPQQYYEDEWHGTREMDGGVLLNQAIHHVDALNWLMGDVHSVFAYMDTLAHQIETPDVAVATIRFVNGAMATIEASTVSYPKNIEGSVALFGERGSVKIGGTALNRKVFWKVDGQLDLEKDILAKEAIDPPTVYGYSHKTQIKEMIAAVREDRQPLTNGYEARRSLHLVLAMHESAETGGEVILNPCCR
ncbi:MAG: Gfo/Idh/MocA family oxidoreductase [Chloroflexota bacterium]|nr:Gfo/Idh/MocA family oxidoreductase [Chloroflexota bacterium]